MTADYSRRKLYCSFCGKEHAEVQRLIAGPTVFICNECVDLCQHIMSGRPLPEPPPRISPVERQRDAAALDAVAEVSPTYRPDKDLPDELRELASTSPVLFPGHVLLSRQDWDRLVVLLARR